MGSLFTRRPNHSYTHDNDRHKFVSSADQVREFRANGDSPPLTRERDSVTHEKNTNSRSSSTFTKSTAPTRVSRYRSKSPRERRRRGHAKSRSPPTCGHQPTINRPWTYDNPNPRNNNMRQTTNVTAENH